MEPELVPKVTLSIVFLAEIEWAVSVILDLAVCQGDQCTQTVWEASGRMDSAQEVLPRTLYVVNTDIEVIGLPARE